MASHWTAERNGRFRAAGGPPLRFLQRRGLIWRRTRQWQFQLEWYLATRRETQGGSSG